MKILTADEMRMADRATIEEEGITSLDLMERAAAALCRQISGTLAGDTSIVLFCGKGNNGGDGYALARMLSESCGDVSVVSVFPEEDMTPECRANFRRLPASVRRYSLGAPEDYIYIPGRRILAVDAVLGTGTKGALRGPAASAVRFINDVRDRALQESGPDSIRVVSIDLPSGLPSEFADGDLCAVMADETLAVGLPKLSLLLPSTGRYAGKLTVVPIGLSRRYIAGCPSLYEYMDLEYMRRLLPGRNVFAHKGDFGHVLIVAGKQGMTGAAILASGGALKSGCGLVTVHVPFTERLAVHISHPSAIVSTDSGACFSALPRSMSGYSAVGVGPGLGQAPETVSALRALLGTGIPAVIDADALNIISSVPEIFGMIPRGSVLTPHIGELRRLVKAAAGISLIRGGEGEDGLWRDEREKLRMVRELASATGAVVVVKGAHTMVCPPSGAIKFNRTGNPGMAKGGSGDVLAGLVAGLLAKGMSAEDAAVAGVYLHGAAGDRAAAAIGEESMNASDILDNLRVSLSCCNP